MKKVFIIFLILIVILAMSGCVKQQEPASVVATTKPVYDFTLYLCQGTDITVSQLITENVSCLHDYTLQVRQMRAIEAAQMVVISGAGLEDFLYDVLYKTNHILDASEGILPLCSEHTHDHKDGHHHETDPHIWMSTTNARQMVKNICAGLSNEFPQYQETIQTNYLALEEKINALEVYGTQQLTNLSTRNMITFHDGFAYFADQWDLTILQALEEESGSEASATELIELIHLVCEYDLPAIFTEAAGSTSAANIIASETNIAIYTLNMGMSDQDYFEMMYHNIDTIKEALG